MPEVVFDVDARALQLKLARLPDELDAAMDNAMDGILERLVARARQTTLFRDRTGAGRQSIRSNGTSGRFSKDTLRGEVLAGGGSVNYMRFVHDGTSGPYEIRPTGGRRALRIPTGTGFIFRRSVMHPGLRPRPFMLEAAEAVEPEIPDIVDAWLDRAIDKAGL